MPQVRVALSDAGVVQRDEREAMATAVESPEEPDLRPTKIALAVVNHDIGSG